MLKNKKLVLIGFILLAAGFIGLKKYFSYSDKVISESSALIEPLKSLMTPLQVEDLLKSKKLSFTVKEDNKLKENDPRPKFHIVSWKIEKFEHLGFQGSLIVLFFNEQLVSTRFYPELTTDYVGALNKNVNGSLVLDSSISLPPKTELRYNKDIEEKKFLEWSDKELQLQMDEWIKHFS